ncbi:hypothetical protein OS189_01015 [Sulfitobacter sp. F26169L]|uniref:hypothetical protein n=1 Tax=Sulfitobacter sp. F26169L TaxID=2996015 RepID=UPI002260A9DF|nr:hypothetical protein [Sulfitobacter sp. F26169L]MCX7564921.1 hypothetical protein [Sulfitobacter sp. F26169L]
MAARALVLHVQGNLDLGPRAYGLIPAAGALGGIAGGWSGAWIISRMGAARCCAGGAILGRRRWRVGSGAGRVARAGARICRLSAFIRRETGY